MSSRNSSRKRFAAWAEERQNADAIPSPDSLPPHFQRFDRKALQLCRQVSRTLSYAFSACGDSVLNDLFVESVEPAPDATRLLVTVMTPDPAQQPIQVLTHLQQASGHLRAEIANDIHRKKVPELAFRCVSPEPPTLTPRDPAVAES